MLVYNFPLDPLSFQPIFLSSLAQKYNKQPFPHLIEKQENEGNYKAFPVGSKTDKITRFDFWPGRKWRDKTRNKFNCFSMWVLFIYLQILVPSRKGRISLLWFWDWICFKKYRSRSCSLVKSSSLTGYMGISLERPTLSQSPVEEVCFGMLIHSSYPCLSSSPIPPQL